MKRFLIIPLLFIAFALSAAPINERQARELATSFFQDSAPTRSATVAVNLVFAGDDIEANTKRMSSVDADSESLLYIYNRNDVDGFVVIAGEDSMRPVIAFSFTKSFDIENSAVATRHMLSAWCKQVAAARARQGSATTYSAASLLNEVGTPICSYKTAEWGQDYPFNNLSPVINGQRSVTGCAATALSILARYYQYPVKGVGTTPEYTYEINGQTFTIPANTLGHTYDYANMPLSYASSFGATQANAVAQLMYDMGTSIKMMFHPEGSASTSNNQLIAMGTYFGFDKESAYMATPTMFGATKYYNKPWVEALKKNLQEFGPTLFSGQATNGGHAFVLDGVTTGDYFSINWGWEGINNGYFLIPEIEYSFYQDAIFGVKTDPSGSSKYEPVISLFNGTAGSTILSGINCTSGEFKQGGTYEMFIGIVTNFSGVDFTGHIAVAHCDKNGTIKRILSNIAEQMPISIPKDDFLKTIEYIDVTISDPIELGDRLRVVYWTDNKANAKWARMNSSGVNVVDEIVMRTTPDEIASKLSFIYDKSNGKMVFKTQLPIVLSIHQTSTNSSVLRQEMFHTYEHNVLVHNYIGKGEHLFSITCGDEPYVLRLNF